LIDGRLYFPGKLNPDNPCQFCDPTLDGWDDWQGLVEGSACSAEEIRPCHRQVGHCVDEKCVPERMDDRTSCSLPDGSGDGVCCDGVCREGGPLVCDGCWIEGEPYGPDVPNPASACQVCNPARDDAAWSLADDGTACGDATDRVCCNGVCCSPTECCGPTGLCEPCGCEHPQGNFKTRIANAADECALCSIEGEVHGPGTPNPANPCEVCDPDRDPGAWSVLADSSPCGDGSGGACCAGACCAEDQCCTGGACGPCGCEIAGQEYAAGEGNPANSCQVCDPSRDRFAWSSLDDDFPCAFDAPRICCGGVCCAAGACCSPATGACDPAACAPDGCTIDGVFYEDFAGNPNNECEYCDASISTTAWSFRGSWSCGPTGQQFCNFRGDCCPLGYCPDLTQPGFCAWCEAVCVIDGVLYYSEDFQPTGGCQICDPDVSHTSWTFRC
jgi:hypothetical protein